MDPAVPQTVEVIDSHTGGEPTRVITAGGPELGAGAVAERLETLRARHDWLRRAAVNEPRGSDALVGALLCEPAGPGGAAGAIFFNNTGYLGMCGHGAIGLAVTLVHLGRIGPGEHRLDTPPGPVTVTVHDRHRVSVANVPSYRHRRGARVDVPGIGAVRGDVVFGGNWFFLVSDHGQALEHRRVDRLTDYAWAVRQALERQGVRGPAGEPVDHIELAGPPSDAARADSRNFVLCPGKAYDRSPCGTGTSARLACLIADGELKEGRLWRQESITGSVFEARARVEGDRVLPVITGSAYVTGKATLLLDPDDPFRLGLVPDLHQRPRETPPCEP